MAWNPAPEVKVARDVAKKLGDVPMCIVFWVTDDNQLGMASYGKTKELCSEAGKLGDVLYERCLEKLSE